MGVSSLLWNAFLSTTLSSGFAQALALPAPDQNGIIPLTSITLERYGKTSIYDNSTIHLPNTAACKNPRIRREWRRLSKEEQLDYLKAVNCMHTKPGITKHLYKGVNNRYDDFVALHINVTNGTIPIHNNGLFLPWHRWVLWVYENALIDECGYKGAQPYWDYYLDGPAYNRHLNESPVWDGEYGFGGNGVIDPTATSNSANPWGTEDVHPPGFNPWGDETVTPPKDPKAAQAIGSGDDTRSDPWGSEEVHPPKDIGAPVGGSSASPLVPSSANASMVTSADDGWAHRRLPNIDNLGFFIDKRDGRLIKRQSITSKPGPVGDGQIPLYLGGPAWPFINFMPLVPPWLFDGLLRPDADDADDDAVANDPSDDDHGASEHRGPTGCVTTGPFKDWKVTLGPGTLMEGNTRCLKRAFEFTRSESALTPAKMQEVMSADTYVGFMELDYERNLNIGPHTIGHRGIGGDMSNLYSSNNDPIWYMHHGYIDRLWTLWQGNNATRLKDVDAPYEGMPPPPEGMPAPQGRTSLDSMIWFGELSPDRTIRTVMDTMNREGMAENKLCYTYDDAPRPGA